MGHGHGDIGGMAWHGCSGWLARRGPVKLGHGAWERSLWPAAVDLGRAAVLFFPNGQTR